MLVLAAPANLPQPAEGSGLLARSRSVGASDGNATICRFHAYSDRLFRAPRAALPELTLYRANSTIVVEDAEDALLRYFLFLKPDGSCHEEGLVACQSVGGARASGGPPAVAGGGAVNHCLARPCKPYPRMELSYARSMLGGGLVGRPHATRALLLGVGAGMIPTWVQESRPGLTLDAVDIAPEVLGAAPCFGLRDGGNVHLFLRDGRSFVAAQPASVYDAIFVDVFTPRDRVPPCLSTVEFFAELRRSLRPGGALVINTWKGEHQQLLATVQSVFHEVKVGAAPGETNAIILAEEGNRMASNVARGEDGEVEAWYAAAGFRRAAPRSADPVWRDLARRDSEWCTSTAADAEASAGGAHS